MKNKKYRILTIEDDPYSQEVLLEMLKLIANDLNVDFQIDMASNGENGLRLFDEHKYDIVLTDINMPQKDGYKVFKHMRFKNKSQKIIAITGVSLEGYKGTMLLFDFDGYIPKPINYDILKSEILKHIL